MAGLVPNVGEEQIFKLLLNKSGTLRDSTLKLFKSNTTPAEGDTAATYTEADFTGYAAVNLVAGDWTITPGAPTAAGCAQKTFTSSAGSQNQPVYGYYIVTQTDNILFGAERFTDGPYTIVNNGDLIKVTPNLTLE